MFWCCFWRSFCGVSLLTNRLLWCEKWLRCETLRALAEMPPCAEAPCWQATTFPPDLDLSGQDNCKALLIRKIIQASNRKLPFDEIIPTLNPLELRKIDELNIFRLGCRPFSSTSSFQESVPAARVTLVDEGVASYEELLEPFQEEALVGLWGRKTFLRFGEGVARLSRQNMRSIQMSNYGFCC